MGHLLDASTAALWRLDSIGAGPTGTTPDIGPSGYTLDNFGGPGAELFRSVVQVSNAVTSLTTSPTTFDGPAIGNAGYLWPIPSTGVYGLRSTNVVSAPDRAAVAGQLTVEAWIFWQGFPSWSIGTICALTDGNYLTSNFTFVVQPSANLAILGYASPTPPGFWAASDSVSLPSYTWVHVAYRRRFDGVNWHHEFFHNGVQTTDDFPTHAPGSAASGLRYTLFDSNGPFAGTIDDVRISSVARSDLEILQSYQRGLGQP